jgi:hypothetical protein
MARGRAIVAVVGDSLLVIEPALRVGERQGHGGQALGGRVDDHHRASLPWFACLLVPDAAPEVDDLLAAAKRTASAAQLPASRKVLGKGFVHSLEAAADVPFDQDAFHCCNGHKSP